MDQAFAGFSFDTLEMRLLRDLRKGGVVALNNVHFMHPADRSCQDARGMRG
jgi:hypothetical protein